MNKSYEQLFIYKEPVKINILTGAVNAMWIILTNVFL